MRFRRIARVKLTALGALALSAGSALGSAEYLWQLSDNFFWNECDNWQYLGEPISCYPAVTTHTATIPYQNTFWIVDVNNAYTVGLLSVADDTEFRNTGFVLGELTCEQIRFSGSLNGTVITTSDANTVATRAQ